MIAETLLGTTLMSLTQYPSSVESSFNREVDRHDGPKCMESSLKSSLHQATQTKRFCNLDNYEENLRILFCHLTLKIAKWKQNTLVLLVFLVQKPRHVVKESPADWQVVTKRRTNETEAIALRFSLGCRRHRRPRDRPHDTWCCPGQTNRVASVRIAIDRLKTVLTALCLFPDAFFPFAADNVKEIAKAGIKAIIQPGGISTCTKSQSEAADIWLDHDLYRCSSLQTHLKRHYRWMSAFFFWLRISLIW